MATTSRLNNYYYCTVNTRKVIAPPSKGEHFSLGGKVYGRPGFDDGTYIQTSSINMIKDGVATTASGSHYTLEEMHPDYLELLSARDSGIPIIWSWSLKGSRNTGYIIIGKVGTDTVKGLVTAQKGNYVYLGKAKYYVVWKNIDLTFTEECKVKFERTYCDLNVDTDFSSYMGDPAIRPNLVIL